MKNIFNVLLVFTISVFTLSSCEDDGVSVSSSENVIDASSKTSWKYYSFEKEDTVRVSDPANSTNWDIAFQRYMIKTNGGKSGKGNAAAFMTSLVGNAGYNALKVVPDTAVFTADDTVKVYGYNPANPAVPSVTNYILNQPLCSWYTLQTGASTTLVPNDNIYIIKTASGKYVKLWIKSYYKDADATPGFMKIQYFYQNDGSKNLK